MKLKKYDSVFLVGPMASGKTTLGKLLAKRLGLKFLDTDQEVEKRSGVSIRLIFEMEGESAFRDRESKTLQALSSQAGVVLATGGGAVLRPENRQVLVARGLVIYLKPDVETQLKRTAGDRKRPLLQNVDRRAFFQENQRIRGPLYEEVADVTMPVDNRPGKKMIEAMLARLQRQEWITAE
ncbi:shikimate kinase [Pseudomonadales bacterium]|jgi:shikimate kinase|nr:shikimate kinase [Pseudomonadales bacterium]